MEFANLSIQVIKYLQISISLEMFKEIRFPIIRYWSWFNDKVSLATLDFWDISKKFTFYVIS